MSEQTIRQQIVDSMLGILSERGLSPDAKVHAAQVLMELGLHG